MTKYTVLLGLFLVALLVLCGCEAEEETFTMQRGINIGNALESPKDIPWDVTMDEAFFDEIVSVGFDTVRLPVRFSDYVGEAPTYTLDETFMTELDGYIQYGLDLGLVVIIDCHHFNEIMEDPNQYQAVLYAIWNQLGTRYQGFSNHLVFEILNEPTNQVTPKVWNQLFANTLEYIRETNPTRLVIVDSPLWGKVEGMYRLDLPEDDNLMVSFHYYEPMEFTFQGDQYQPEYMAYHDVTWTGTEEEMTALVEVFQEAHIWAEEQGVSIMIGEFGSNQQAPRESRLLWTQAVIDTAESFGFPWCYWEMASQFGIYDADAQCWDEEMLAHMLPQ